MGEANVTSTQVHLTGGTQVWFDPQHPTEIHITIDDEDVTHPTTGKPGLHLTVSANPRSANFNPKPFNTLRATLTAHNKPAPVVEADESIPRRIDRRRSWMDW